MANWESLRDRGERAWLFWPRPRPGRLPQAIKRYLAAGLDRETHKGQKTSERDLWYLTEINPPADGFMSGMTSVGPWICLNRASDLTATNTLYTIHFHDRLRWGEQAAWALSLLCATAQSQYDSIGRSLFKRIAQVRATGCDETKGPNPGGQHRPIN